jgi:predicted Zn-dependent protease
VRSYRQAKRYAARATPSSTDPAALQLEMAAALILAGQHGESVKELAELSWPELTALERNGVPQWARDVLPPLPK